MCERCACDDSEAKSGQVYLAGEAGVGKSFVVKALVPAIKQLSAKSGQDLDKPSVLVLAPSATAAFLIDGGSFFGGGSPERPGIRQQNDINEPFTQGDIQC